MKSRPFQLIITAMIIISIVVPNNTSLAANNPSLRELQGDPERGYNPETGRLAFIGGGDLASVQSASSIQAMSTEDRAMSMAATYGTEFGLTNPASELEVLKSTMEEGGRSVVRYQQVYKSIPIYAGQLIVNMDAAGRLLSMSGEISPELSLDVTPSISSDEATQMALGLITKYYKVDSTDLNITQPELWIFDESLLTASTRAPELVWQMEVTPVDPTQPIRELVMVNAQTGAISLHFNQIDTAWYDKSSSAPVTSVSNTDLLQTGVTWYVATTGSNSNNCSTPSTPCQTINGALAKTTASGTIKVAMGTYTFSGSGDPNVVTITKSITLSGGWNSDFSTQTGASIIDGEDANNGILATTSAGPLITVVVDRFIIQNCKTIMDGGGVYVFGANFTLQNSTIKNNFANNYGSGIYAMYGASLGIINSTISHNDANTRGGGIYLHSGTVNTLSSTIAFNQANDRGGGLYKVNGIININNTILAMNTGLNSGNDCSGMINSLGYNIIGTTWGCTISQGTGDQINVYPKIDNSFSEPFSIHALLAGSPAIDSGDPVNCPSTDERGMVRPQGTGCDIGAFEGSNDGTPITEYRTYTLNHSQSLPGNLLCDHTQPTCTNGTDVNADSVHRYTLDTLSFYSDHHGRNSIDGYYMTIISSVHYGSGYLNAFWNGSQIIYGDDFVSDDIVGHEFTHGVTDYESGLVLAFQSGAISESFSDLWSEFIDQTNGLGTDSEAVKWQIGEDSTSTGYLRSMSDPPSKGDPDKITSPYFYLGMDDNGGVHTNSGVNNKAVYLMVDGGTFNGKTVTGIGIDKTAAIYYEVQTNLLGAGANYTDLYYALNQACANLINGSEGISASDCDQVKNAAEAVEMNVKPSQTYFPIPDACPAGFHEGSVSFFDDMENGDGNWTFGATSGVNSWMLTEPGIASPTHSLYGESLATINASHASMKNNVIIPFGGTLYFKHWVDLEGYYDENDNLVESNDGGILEYSTNSGATWIDTGALFSAGQNYNGTLSSEWGNPLAGRMAFSGFTPGMVGSRYNLASLAGQNVRFRWRVASDDGTAYSGWWVDDIKIYQCLPVGEATLVSPTGSIGPDYNPTYTWNAPALGNAPTRYYLWINGPSGKVLDKWYEASAICNSGSCSVTPGTTLIAGNYQWWVQTYNGAGYGPWSSGMSFSVSLVGAASLLEPTGSIGTDYTPDFAWSEVSGATWYYLYINGPAGNVFKQWYQASAVCSGGTCTVVAPVTLGGGSHTWYVQTYNSAGLGPWSDGMAFSTTMPTIPGAAILTSPTSDIGTDYSPDFVWDVPLSGTAPSWYRLYVNGPSGMVLDQWYQASAVCSGESCTVASPVTLGGGSHTWYVQTYNSAGLGPWSDAQNFTVTP